jgi:hypothetical protein
VPRLRRSRRRLRGQRALTVQSFKRPRSRESGSGPSS